MTDTQQAAPMKEWLERDTGAKAVAIERTKREAPGPHFVRVAKIWSAILDHEVTAEQVVLCMVGLKVAREAGMHDPDNMVDAGGYSSLSPEVRNYVGGLE